MCIRSCYLGTSALNMCAQSYLTLCNPMECSPPGSFVHGIFQARILEWVAISFSRGSSRPRDQTSTSCIARQLLYHWAICEAPRNLRGAKAEDMGEGLSQGRPHGVLLGYRNPPWKKVLSQVCFFVCLFLIKALITTGKWHTFTWCLAYVQHFGLPVWRWS